MTANGPSRRTFLRTVGGSAVAIGAFGLADSPLAAASSVPRVPSTTRFAIDSAPSVLVSVTGGRRFGVTVTDLDGNVLERHRWLTVNRLFRIRSERFTVSTLDVPAA